MSLGSEGKTELISRFNFTYIQIQAAKVRRDNYLFFGAKKILESACIKHIREHVLKAR